AAVGTAFFAVRMLDIGFDPALGVLMDRTRTRLGRFRPWLIASAPVLMLASALLFMASPGVTIVYLWAALLVGSLGFSMGSLSQTAWGATLSTDYNQRSRIYGWWQAGNVLGMLLILMLPPILQTAFGASHGDAVRAMGWFILITLPLTVALAVFCVGEPDRLGAATHRARLSDYGKLIGVGSVRRLMLADLLLGWAPGLTAALFFFYFGQVKGIDQKSANWLLLAYFVAGLVGAPLWAWLSDRIGKHRALAAAAALMIAAQLHIFFIPKGNLTFALVSVAIAGLPFSGAAILLRAMLADVGDEVRLKTGADFTGILYSVLTGARKVADALAVLVGFWILQWMGFDPKAAVNSPESLRGLEILFIALPSVIAAVAAWMIYRFPLDAKRHAEIRAQLALRDGAAA
ncbi:MAG: MFS transporter, partial [Caulobacteraceae bacterium]